MPKARWIISSDNVKNSITGKKGDSAAVYSDEDLKRRQAAAKAAGVELKVRKVS